MKSKFRQRKKLTKPLLPELNLTPLIDTALTLTIIFMVAGQSAKKENALKIELPKGKVTEVSAQNQKELIVSVEKNGKINFKNTYTTAEKLVKDLKGLIEKTADKTVFVKADTGVSYGKVIELVDTIKQVQGVKYVALATTATEE